MFLVPACSQYAQEHIILKSEIIICHFVLFINNMLYFVFKQINL